MKIGVKDIVLIAVVVICTFPLIYLGVLVGTGNAKIVFNTDKNDASSKIQEFATLKYSKRADSLLLRETQVFSAAQREKSELEQERKSLVKQQERIAFLQEELEATRKSLAEERKKYEKLVSVSDTLQIQQIKQLAKIYGAMRANEAALILETLDTGLLVKILKEIGDERQRAKILSALSRTKAAEVSQKMSAVVKKR